MFYSLVNYTYHRALHYYLQIEVYADTIVR